MVCGDGGALLPVNAARRNAVPCMNCNDALPRALRGVRQVVRKRYKWDGKQFVRTGNLEYGPAELIGLPSK